MEECIRMGTTREKPSAHFRPAGTAPPGQATGEFRERKLLARIRARFHALLAEACKYSSVPVEFLAALIANESGGDPRAMRFEPAVYRHLRRVADGQAAQYGGITRARLSAEFAEMLHPKGDAFHSAFMTEAFAAAHAQELRAAEDEALRELASSWGLTQIMGYHMTGRAGTVRDLLEPRFHFRMALELLADFAARFQLDLGREFPEMFRCWNTGQPYGATTDPRYCENGLRRMEIYRAIERSGD
jgi:hypothetical protein